MARKMGNPLRSAPSDFEPLDTSFDKPETPELVTPEANEQQYDVMIAGVGKFRQGSRITARDLYPGMEQEEYLPFLRCHIESGNISPIREPLPLGLSSSNVIDSKPMEAFFPKQDRTMLHPADSVISTGPARAIPGDGIAPPSLFGN